MLCGDEFDGSLCVNLKLAGRPHLRHKANRRRLVKNTLIFRRYAENLGKPFLFFETYMRVAWNRVDPSPTNPIDPDSM